MTRLAAYHVLRSGHPFPTRQVDVECHRLGMDPRDRGFVRQLVGLEIRRRSTLRAILGMFLERKPKPELITHLNLGLVQLLFMDRVPDHAALSETLDAVNRTLGASKVPFVNGVLHNVIRARGEGLCGDPQKDLIGVNMHMEIPVFRHPETHPLLWAEDAYSIPAPLFKRWVKRYGQERAERLARTFLNPPPLVLRALGDREALLEELATLEVQARAGNAAGTIVCGSNFTGAVMESAAFREGRLTVQGETAAAAGELLQPQAGESLIDLCAAPGGKTAVLAASGAKVLAIDVEQRRLERVLDTCTRLGVQEHVKTLVSDGLAALPAEQLVDGILIDAPCSNTGVLGARAEARWRFGPAQQTELKTLQARLLREAAAHTRPGGRIVWSTCSIEPEENERQMKEFLNEFGEWSLEEERAALPDTQAGPWDGGYCARLRRSR